jgi:hypothetical protein
MDSNPKIAAALLALTIAVAAPLSAQQTFNDEATFQSTLSCLTVINFDTIAANTVVNSQYLSVGADFQPFNGGTPQTVLSCCNPSPNSIRTWPSSMGGGGFAVAFSGQVFAVGLKIIDLQNLDPSSLKLFDTTGSIASFVLQDEIGFAPSAPIFFGVITSAPIARMELTIGSNDYLEFDDLQFGIPQPCEASASWLNYGAGCPGTNGTIPSLLLSAAPKLGSTVQLQATNSQGAPASGLLIIGLTPGATPLFGCQLLISAPFVLVVPLTIPAAGVALPFQIPCDEELCGQSVFFQLLESDPGASHGVSFTPGLEMKLGS